MQSTLGWTVLSREALRQTEKHLADDQQGVRDEIGFLSLHQGYADRFFPGTSVLQTRLRYVLFIPWLYNQLAQAGGYRRSVDAAVRDAELALTSRLKATQEAGIIGGRAYPRSPVQPASQIYWHALQTWGILRPWFNDLAISRAAFHRALGHRRSASSLHDDDKQPLEETLSFFVTLPQPPAEWHNPKTPLDFNLRKSEANFLHQQLVNVKHPYSSTTPSLLARLVEHQIPVDRLQAPWLQSILSIADAEDRAALIRAQQAAALAAVGRAVYAVLVEYICEVEDKRPVGNEFRADLEAIVKNYGPEAGKLDVPVLYQDIPQLPGILHEVLDETQRWLKRSDNFLSLRPIYEKVEVVRKDRRARLARTLAGRERRAEWDPEAHPLARPLSYRWLIIQRLLGDLRKGL